MDVLQDLDLYLRGIPVLLDALDDFDCHILFLLSIPALSNLAKGSFANDLEDLVPRDERFPKANNIVPILYHTELTNDGTQPGRL